MSKARDTELYPRYCFHLSPTVNAWCWLRISDIDSLKRREEFDSENFFFFYNLPIKWVRITGLVVAVREADHSRLQLLTIDDSSGKCIDAVIKVQPVTSQGISSVTNGQTSIVSCPTKPRANIIVVGDIVDVKGSLSIYRGSRQIEVEKATIVKSTAQELMLWQKRSNFRRDTLDRPWVLNSKDVRRCRREAENSGSSKASYAQNRRNRMVNKATEMQQNTQDKSTNTQTGRDGTSSTKTDRMAKSQTIETRKKLLEMLRDGSVEGKYNALGL